MKESKRSKDFDRMIIEAIREKFSFFAWQSIAGIIEKCELKVKAYRKDFKEIELELLPDQDGQLSKVISGNKLLNVYVPGLSVSFTSELKSISEDKKIKIYSPKEFTFFERRKHERVIPAKTCFVSFEHNGRIVRKSIYDFSMGGIAIVLPRSDKILVKKNKESRACVLEIGLKKIKIKAECVNSSVVDRFKVENLPYGGFKIAFRFIEMAKDDKAYFVEFIIHELLSKQIHKKAN